VAPDDEGIGAGMIALLVICGVVLFCGIGMQFRRKPTKVYIESKSDEQIALEEMEEKKAEEEERLRKDAERKRVEEERRREEEEERRRAEEEEERRKAEEQEIRKAEFNASLVMKPHYTHLGEAGVGMVGVDLQEWLKKKNMDLDDIDVDDDDDDDDDALLDILEKHNHAESHISIGEDGQVKHKNKTL
jgi:PAS domain-containing protein